MYNFIHVSNSLYKRKKSEVFYTEILIDQRVYSLVVQKQEVITNRKELSNEITSKTFVPIPFISPPCIAFFPPQVLVDTFFTSQFIRGLIMNASTG